MTKKIICVVGLIGVLALSALISIPKESLREIPSRLALYHNFGEISLVADGEKIDLDNIKIFFDADGERHEEGKIKNGKFSFNKGIYGHNTFSFEIPHKGVTAQFGSFNTNWWHVADYSVAIELSTIQDNRVKAHMKQTVTVLEDSIESESEAVIDDANSIVKVYAY